MQAAAEHTPFSANRTVYNKFYYLLRLSDKASQEEWKVVRAMETTCPQRFQDIF